MLRHPDPELRFKVLYELTWMVKKMEEIDGQNEIVTLLDDIAVVGIYIVVVVPYRVGKFILWGMLLLILGNKLHKKQAC